MFNRNKMNSNKRCCKLEKTKISLLDDTVTKLMIMIKMFQKGMSLLSRENREQWFVITDELHLPALVV